MPTVLHDLSVTAAWGLTVPPDTYDEAPTATAIDMMGGDGPGFAILIVGALDGGVAGRIQESDDQDDWTDIDGSDFTAVSADNTMRVSNFTRTQRYVRAAIELTGETPEVALAVVVGHQKKLM